MTNLTHLSKILERAMLDHLVLFLEEVGVVPRYQSAYKKLHSTETALCKIHDDLVSNTCHGKASILVLLDFSRIRRNLSIHIARFSASESLRAHINTPKNPHFSLVAGTSPVGMRPRARQRMRQHPTCSFYLCSRSDQICR